ncbi:hypothetical protein ACWEN0_46860, partial [Amycolatopsis sp. NPDC004378]
AGPFGLTSEWLLHGGRPIADMFVLSHSDQLGELERNVPEALPSAVVAGDPCFDRITASLPLRDRYRAALGVGDRTLVLVTSTWSTRSLLGARPNLPRELVAELSPDSFAVALVVHPNTTHGQGPAAVRQWYADCLRSGMLVLDEVDGWRAGLIAADVAVGDVGSVTGYHAALGKPTVLATFDEVPPATPISALGERAPRLPPSGPYLPSLRSALKTPAAELFAPVTEQTTSIPGDSLRLLRKHFYTLLDLPEPTGEVAVAVVPADRLAAQPPALSAHFVTHEVDAESGIVRLSRHAAEVRRLLPDSADDLHVSCGVDHPVRTLRAAAGVLVCGPDDPGPDQDDWHRGVFERHPACSASAVAGSSSTEVRFREGTVVTLSAPSVPADALASVPYAWHAAGLGERTMPPQVTLLLGDRRHPVSVTYA